MKLNSRPFLVSAAIAVFGLLARAITNFLIFTYPARYLTQAETQAYLDTWFHTLATAGNALAFDVTPLLALVAAFYLVYVDGEHIQTVLSGFVAASIVFAFGIAVMGWFVFSSPPRPPSAFEAITQPIPMLLRLAVPAILAAVVGQYLNHRSTATPS